MESTDPQSLPPPPVRRRGLVVSVVMNAVLLVLVCALALYAFMLNVDLGDIKRRMSREVEARQQADRYLIETRNQLLERQREVEQLKTQLAYREPDFESAAAVKSTLPVMVNFRSSILGRGLVAVIENLSPRYLTVVLSVRNPALGTARQFKLQLEPQSKADFGHLEGWEFVSGDEVVLVHDGFAPLRLSVP